MTRAPLDHPGIVSLPRAEAALMSQECSMDFALTEEQQTFREMVHRWVDA